MNETAEAEVTGQDQGHEPAEQVQDAAIEQQPDQPEAGTAETGEEVKHPLEPGGKRFNEIYARAKRAEEEREALKDKLHQEQLERARLEGERKAAEEAKKQQPTEREYTWDELENFIEAGRITRAQANAYKEERIAKRIKSEFESVLDAKLNVTTKVQTINQDLERYKAAMPAMLERGTPERVKLEKEYHYLVNTLGYPDNLQTQLAAARAAFGPPEAVENAAKTRTATTQQRTSFMDTTTSKKPEPPKKDPVQALDDRAKDHYTRMIKNGRYGTYKPHIGITAEHWAKVREELTWTRKR